MTDDTSGETTLPNSERCHEEATKIFPGGVSHNVRYAEPHPVYAKATDGAVITDVDGNEYVDFWNNHHASVLGHTHPAVVEAVQEQVANGLHYGTPHERAVELAELVREFVPSAERLRFCGSGTEATMYAVRLARAATGREQVFKVEGHWHGGNTDLAVGVYPPFDAPTTEGLPPGVRQSVTTFPLNDGEALDRRLDQHRGNVAAVIVDPRKAGVEPTAEFLEHLDEMREEHEFELIFDEVVTGFRVSPGSYQARCSITPDLTTLGKCLGGGLPVGAIAGRAELFDVARPDIAVPASKRVIAGGGTYSANPMTVTAGLQTLTLLRNDDVYDRLESKGERVRRGLQAQFSEFDITGTVLGFSSLFLPVFGVEPPVTSPTQVYEQGDSERLQQYHRKLLERGYFFIPGAMGNVTLQHTDEHVEGLLRASRDVLAELEGESERVD